jgi:hypothetical protein
MQGDIILLSLREFEDAKADVIVRYTPDEARNLKTYGELKSDFQIHENQQAEGEWFGSGLCVRSVGEKRDNYGVGSLRSPKS